MRKIFTAIINLLLIPYKLFTGKSIISLCTADSVFQKKVRYRGGCKIYHSKIGKYSYIGQKSILNKCSIGKFCSISSNVYVGLPSHPTTFVSTSPLFLNGKNIFNFHFSFLEHTNLVDTKIGNDVWIGTNALIKSGVIIGDGAVIGAGSVVTKNVPPYAIVAGCPAQIIRSRFNEETIAKLITTKWWDWDPKKIKLHNFASVDDFLKNENSNNI